MHVQTLRRGPFVKLHCEPTGAVTAEVVGLPEVRATAATRNQALEAVGQVLDEWLADGRIVSLEISEENPWTKHAGWAKDDPEYSEFLEALRQQRQELDNPLPSLSVS